MANGIAGYTCLVRRSGTSTTVSGEACTNTTGNTFRITAAAKRVIDPNMPLNFQDGGATVSFSLISSLDFLNGVVTFATPRGGAITFNGNFLPITTSSEVFLESKSYKLGLKKDLLGTDVFSGTTSLIARRRIAGLEDVQLDVESLAQPADLLVLDTAKDNGTVLVTEVYFGADTTPRFRGFCLVENVDRSATVDGLVMTNVTFKIASQTNTTTGLTAGYTINVAQP